MSAVVIDILAGEDQGRTFSLDGDVLSIGRSAHNDVQLAARHVSAEHARIVLGADGVYLEDLGSTNGTAVVRGSERIELGETPKVLLQNGDVLELGGPVPDGARVRVTLSDDADAEHVVSVRAIADIVGD